ncbi:MAG TPA: TetR family transcriptional regulator [Gaiellaceae bacterium]|nr:TetR family transcriptional regulator [Gaiellaceae bacterium]
MEAEQGLRERKKERTRQAIAEAAQRLFQERGFDAVSVAEVAREADVSQGTVFNYFPTKEDLFYGQMETFEAALLEAVRKRPPGESVLEAFRGFVLERSKGLAERADVIAAAARVIDASPALQAREREVVAESTASLAALIAEETGPPGGVEPAVVANALMGAQRALVEHVRASVLAGRTGAKLVRDTRAQGRRAFDRLERGLAEYAVKGG